MKTKEKTSCVHLASVSTVVPSFSATQQETEIFTEKNYRGKIGERGFNIMHKVLNHPSIQKRHYSVDNFEVFLNEDADNKIKRFTDSAVELSSKAIKESLLKAEISTKEVTALVVNTCTGYICPGISTYLIEKLDLNKNIQSYDLVGSGCGGAIPNIKICEALAGESTDNIVLSVSVEICSSVLQMTNDPSQLVSNCIFGDGASASVLWNRPLGLKLVGIESLYIPEYREDIRFIHKDGQLHNKLSSRLPVLTGKAASKLIDNLLRKSVLKKEDIKHWAFHPGGENVINAVKKEVGLNEEQLSRTRSVLSKYGNMSSPTVMFVLNEILNKGVNVNDWLIAVSFGAGFSAHAYLLRV